MHAQLPTSVLDISDPWERNDNESNAQESGGKNMTTNICGSDTDLNNVGGNSMTTSTEGRSMEKTEYANIWASICAVGQNLGVSLCTLDDMVGFKLLNYHTNKEDCEPLSHSLKLGCQGWGCIWMNKSKTMTMSSLQDNRQITKY